MIKRALGCFIFIMIPMLIGSYIGMEISDRKLTGVDTPWLSMPLPYNAEPVSFIEGVGSIAYIRSRDGKLFMMELEEYRHPPAWREVEGIVPEAEMDRRIAFGSCTPVEVGSHPRWDVEPPSTSIAQLNCLHSVNPEHNVEMVFVILEDDDVRRWIRDDPGLGALGVFLIYMGLGAVLGAASGLLLYGLILWIRGRGAMERRRYLSGEVARSVLQANSSDPTPEWLDRLDDEN